MEEGRGLTGQCGQCAACRPAMMWQCSCPHVRPLHPLSLHPYIHPIAFCILTLPSPSPRVIDTSTQCYSSLQFQILLFALTGFESLSDNLHLKSPLFLHKCMQITYFMAVFLVEGINTLSGIIVNQFGHGWYKKIEITPNITYKLKFTKGFVTKV